MLNNKRWKAFISLATIIAIVLNIMMFVSFAPIVNAAVVDSGKCGDIGNWMMPESLPSAVPVICMIMIAIIVTNHHLKITIILKKLLFKMA